MSASKNGHSLETWRLLIVRREGEEVLVRTTGARHVLPQVEIPAQQRIAANINPVVEREFGLRVISLYEVVVPGDLARPERVPYHAVAAICPAQQPPGDSSWICTRSLSPGGFARAEDFAAIDALRSALETRGADRAARPFLEPDWFAGVRKWIARSLRPHCLRLSGKFRQFNASPTFSLIRFETSHSPVWFKAVGAPNFRERAVTLILAQRCPDFLPRILASRERWNAWLSLQAPGKSLGSRGEIGRWKSAARSLARLQIASRQDGERLLTAGAHDLRVSRLLSLLDPYFQFVADCTGRSPLQSSKNLTLLEVSELKDVTRAVLRDFDGLGLAETVGHMDLSPGNIFCTAGRAVFLDWAEAFVGSPIFSFEYLLQHFRRTVSREPSLAAAFRNAYLQPWRGRIPPKDFRRALLLAPLAALFAYAVTIWSCSEAGSPQQPFRERYLLSLTRKMRTEAVQRDGEQVLP